MCTLKSNRHPEPRALLLPAWLLGAALAALPVTATPETGYDFDARVATVTALLDAGRPLAQRPEIATALATVQKLQREAVTLRTTGRPDAARTRLDEAYILLRVIMRSLVANPAVAATAIVPDEAPVALPGGDGRERRYATLAASVDAFEATYRAVYAERGAGHPDLGLQVHELAAAAARHHAAGDLDTALVEIKTAYTLLQQQIVRLRGGQTLVRALSFTSDREEYDYEMGRHDTHLLLVDMLLDTARHDPPVDREVRLTVDRSMRLHWLAHKLADSGDYRQAVATLEQATDALVNLIRSYGFDIPN